MAIYPPPPFPGGNYPSPFPRTCSSSPSPASSFPSAPDLHYAATYPPQIHHHHPFGFGAPAPAYAPAPFPAYTPAPVTAAATHSFPSPYLSAPAPFPSTFPPPTSSSTSFPFRSSHAPVYAPAPAVSSPIPTQVHRNQPPPAAAQIHGTLSHHHFPSTPVLTPLLHRPDQASGYSSAPATFSFPCSQAPPSAPPTPATPPTLAPPPRGALSLSATADTTRLRHPDQVPSNPLPAGRSSPTPQLLDAVPTAPNTGSRIHSMVNASLNNRFFMDDDAAVQAVGDKRVPAKETIRHRLQRELLNIQARLDLEQAHERTSFNAIQCELAKLKSMVSQFVDTVGKQPISARGSKPEQSQLFSIVPAAPAHAAPKVFGETPTPISWQETHDMAPDYCFGHDNSIQSSCASKSIEQNLNARPQPYGLHNLNRQSVLLADGTKHSYFTLPTDYPLERVVREPMFDVYDNESDGCSNEFVQVFTGSPEQQTYEVPENYPLARATSKQISAVYDEITEGDSTEFVDVLAGIHEQHTHEEDRHETEQPPKCFSKQTFSPERPTVGAFSLTNEEPICGIEKLNGGEKMSFATQDKEQLLKCYSKVSAFRNVPDVYVRRTCQEESQGKEKLFREKYVCQTVTGLSILLFPWDPGATKFPVLFITVAQVRKLLCTNVFKSELTCSYEIQKYICRTATGHSIIFIPWDPGDTKLHVMFKCAAGATNLQCTDVYKLAIVQTLVVKFGAGRAPIFKYAIICADAFGLGCTEVNASVLFVLVPCSTGTSCSLPSFENRAKLQWNPGVLNIIGDMRIDKYAVSHQVQFIKMITEHSFLSLTACIQYICPNDISSELHATCFILQRSAHLTQDNYLCSVYWNNVMKTSYVWDPGVKISLYSWLDILTVWSETDKPLSCTHIPDLAAWHNQSVGSGTSYIWDPGTILWYTFVSVSNTLNAYYLAVRHSNGRSIYYPENIMCYLTVSTVLEEKEMPSGQSIRFRSFRLAPMQCNDYQTCNSLSFQQHSHQDITFCEIALWLIHFQPP